MLSPSAFRVPARAAPHPHYPQLTEEHPGHLGSSLSPSSDPSGWALGGASLCIASLCSSEASASRPQVLKKSSPGGGVGVGRLRRGEREPLGS